MAAAASPSSRATSPGVSASFLYSAMRSPLLRVSPLDSSHSICNAPRPCLAAHKPPPSPATPRVTGTTPVPPFTARAPLSSTAHRPPHHTPLPTIPPEHTRPPPHNC